jgi:hypothetical protein
MASTDQSGDRVLRETTWVSVVVVAVLLPALVILWGLPAHTKTLWAWTIKPAMTPIFMGSAYGAGAYFFTRVSLSRRWHTGSAGVLSAAVFAAFMLVVTFAHFGKFNHGNAPFLAAVAFYGWTGVYIVSPFVVAWLWMRNQRTDSRRADPGDPVVPSVVRYFARAVSAGAIALGLVFLFSPTAANDIWAWKLTPLAAGVVGSFTIQVGTGASCSRSTSAGAHGDSSSSPSSSLRPSSSSDRSASGARSTIPTPAPGSSSPASQHSRSQSSSLFRAMEAKPLPSTAS